VVTRFQELPVKPFNRRHTEWTLFGLAPMVRLFPLAIPLSYPTAAQTGTTLGTIDRIHAYRDE
jgi:hypothetical protein